MAITFQRNVGMLLLGIWLVLYGLAGIVPLGLPSPLMAVLALLSGIPSWRVGRLSHLHRGAPRSWTSDRRERLHPEVA